MALLQQPFNALQHNPEMGVPSLPLGLKQPVRIIASEVKGAKENNNNGMASFTVEVLDGVNKGAQGAINFNIYNQNGEAARIAHDHLSAMAYAIGVVQFQDTQALHNIPFMIDVTPQKVKAGSEDKGYVEVSAYYDQFGNKPKRGQIPGQQAQGSGQQVQQGQTGNWNTGGGQQVQNNGQQQQDPNAGQQQQNFNNNQQQQQGNFGGGGQQVDPNQNQQQSQFNNGQQQQPQNNGGQAAWNSGQQQQANTGNGGGGAPWSKQG